MDSKKTETDVVNIFENPLILKSIFNHLTLDSLRTCRLVNSTWNDIATAAVRRSLKTRFILSADTKCTNDLKKFIEVYRNGTSIPYTRALLILDHLPSPTNNGRRKPQEGEVELLLQISELFSGHVTRRPQETYTTLLRSLPLENGEAVKTAMELFSKYIDNLILNMTHHQKTPENMEYWLTHISFPNLSELSFHITRTAPDDLSHASILTMLNSLPSLRSFGLRKLTKKGDELMNTIIGALVNKSYLNRITCLSLEILTVDKTHLETLLTGNFSLERLSLIYLGGEVRFTEKLDLIKRFLLKISDTLQHLYTHLPLFSRDQRNLPQMPKVKLLKIEKVYREFSVSQAQIFDFDFHYYFPRLEKVIFKDYDIWKNMLLKTFPTKEVVPCKQIDDISLPDLCFDLPLMKRYLMKFPNLRNLSMIVSYVSRYQKDCSYCLVYSLLPQLKELNISIFEVDIPIYDQLFTGLTPDQCRKLLREKRAPKNSERGASITMLKDLEVLRISSLHGNRDLGITDFSVTYGFLEMPSLRHLYIGSSHITHRGMAQLAQKMDLTIWHKSACNCKCCRESTKPASSSVPEKRNGTVMETTNFRN